MSYVNYSLLMIQLAKASYSFIDRQNVMIYFERKDSYKMIKIMCIFNLIVGFTFFTTSLAEANNAPKFSVSPIIPENQINDVSSYFNLRMEAGKEQNIEVELTNNRDSSIEIEIKAVTAKSNQNGVIDYSQLDEDLDPSLLISFSEISEVEQLIVLKANESKKVPITIKLPSVKFDGVILGGLNFSEKIKAGEEHTQISNQFSYSLAVMISQTDEEVVPILNLEGISASQSNYRNVINAEIQNSQAVIVTDMSIDAQVYRKNEKEPLFNRRVSNFQMAPNSRLPFYIHTGSAPLVAGDYRLEMQATVNGENWEWEEEFTIDEKTAVALNKTAVDLDSKQNGLIYLLVGSGLTIGLLSFGVLINSYVKKEKEKKALEEKRKARREKKQLLERKKRNALKKNQIKRIQD